MIAHATKLVLFSVLLGGSVVAQVMVGQGGAKLDASLQVGANGYNRAGVDPYGMHAQRYEPHNRQMTARSAQANYIRQDQFYYSPERFAPDPTITARNAAVGRPTGPQIAQSGTSLDNNLQIGSSGYYNPRNIDRRLEASRYQPANPRMRAQSVSTDLITYQTRAQNYSPRRTPAVESPTAGQTTNRTPSNRVR